MEENKKRKFNEVVDKILKELSRVTSLTVADEANNHYDLDYNDAYRVVDVLMYEGLAVKNKDGITMKITENGRKAVENGGYLVYLKSKEREAKREEKDKKFTSGFNEWQYKTRWWPHIISIGALILSVIALFQSCDN